MFLSAVVLAGFGGKRDAVNSASDWVAAGESAATKGSAKSALPETVWVMALDGSLSCGEAAGKSVEKGAAPLRAAGIQPLASLKRHDGMMRPAVCGTPTGMVNLYRIERRSLDAALAAGFAEAPAGLAEDGSSAGGAGAGGRSGEGGKSSRPKMKLGR